jgi:hypothetical protein
MSAKKRSGGDPIRATLSMNQLVDGTFKIKLADIQRIVASGPGKQKRK